MSERTFIKFVAILGATLVVLGILFGLGALWWWALYDPEGHPVTAAWITAVFLIGGGGFAVLCAVDAFNELESTNETPQDRRWPD